MKFSAELEFVFWVTVRDQTFEVERMHSNSINIVLYTDVVSAVITIAEKQKSIRHLRHGRIMPLLDTAGLWQAIRERDVRSCQNQALPKPATLYDDIRLKNSKTNTKIFHKKYTPGPTFIRSSSSRGCKTNPRYHPILERNFIINTYSLSSAWLQALAQMVDEAGASHSFKNLLNVMWVPLTQKENVNGHLKITGNAYTIERRYVFGDIQMLMYCIV